MRTIDGKVPAPGGSIAVAAVDEGLLELRANDSWKLLDAMMGQRAYQVETSAAEMQVVGKRHFGIKAIPPGGGGGHQITRELFDTLLMWKASLPLDSKGDATIEVPLNDSLTLRIVAIATFLWTPSPGAHNLSIVCGPGRAIRTIEFVVRGSKASTLEENTRDTESANR
ncbi:MAG TPA: hypothetical protein VE243_06025 [Candidatus Acidoferrum sp.]|nr:hypothetical protein [Candidatus Acidoferrum sp.]